MAKGLYTRIKRWIRREALNFDDLNAEFDNVLNNFIPTKVDDYSETVSQMQTQTDPGESGSESQATTLAGEIARLRNMLVEITGKTYWYETPVSNLLSLNTIITDNLSIRQNQVISGRVDSNNQPMFLVPNGSAATVKLEADPTNLRLRIAGTEVTFTSDLTKTSLTTAPSSNNTCAVNNSAYADQEYTKWRGEWGTQIEIGTVGSEITALNGKVAAFKINNGTDDEFFTALIDTTNGVLINCSRALFFDSVDDPTPRIVFSNTDTITLLKLTWVFATYESSTPGLDVTYNAPYIQDEQPGSPSGGDYWFDTSAEAWKKFDGSTWATQSAVFVGICAQDSTNCIVARSVDFDKTYRQTNSVSIVKSSDTVLAAALQRCAIDVYGAEHRFNWRLPSWDITLDLDAGSEASSTTYYAYVTDTGDTKLSVEKPHDRRGDLLGLYHPYKPWRYVGEAVNDSSSDFDTVIPCEREADRVICDYYASSTTISSSSATIVYSSKRLDSHGAYVSGTFTSPKTAFYDVVASLFMGASYAGDGDSMSVNIENAGGSISTNVQRALATGGPGGRVLQVSATGVYLQKGETLKITAGTEGSTPAITASNSANFVTIVEKI